MTCSEVQDNYFYRGIDYLILEAEDASADPVIITDSQNGLFTGTGFYNVEDAESVVNFGSLTPPVSGLYEVVIRYNLEGTLFWNSSTLTIIPSSEVMTGPADCGDSSEITDQSSFQYADWMMGVGLSVTRTFCLRGGRSYQFVLSDFISGRNDDSAVLSLDSLVLIAVDSSEVASFSDSGISSDYRDCVMLYRSLATRPAEPPISCQQSIFTVSTEIYNGAAGESISFIQINKPHTR